MNEDEETMPIEEQEEEQEQPIEDDDARHLDLGGDWETQAYNLIKNREFIHMPAYDPNLLEKIGMDVEFSTI
jgi:hypothetical protein